MSLPGGGHLPPIAFDAPEAAALIASLAALGPSVSQSATSAMHKVTEALQSD